MNLKSEYYSSFEETMEHYEIPEEAYPFAGESLQPTEDLFFGFTIYLIS